MRQDEEKNEVEGTPKEEEDTWVDRDRDVIVRLSERFEVFTAQVIKKMDELLSMRDMVEKLLRRQTSKRSNDAERKRKERMGEIPGVGDCGRVRARSPGFTLT